MAQSLVVPVGRTALQISRLLLLYQQDTLGQAMQIRSFRSYGVTALSQPGQAWPQLTMRSKATTRETSLRQCIYWTKDPNPVVGKRADLLFTWLDMLWLMQKQLFRYPMNLRQDEEWHSKLQQQLPDHRGFPPKGREQHCICDKYQASLLLHCVCVVGWTELRVFQTCSLSLVDSHLRNVVNRAHFPSANSDTVDHISKPKQ